MPIHIPALNDSELAQLLADDVPCGDLTTETLGIGTQPARLEFRARMAMTVCAGEEAIRLFELAGAHASLLSRCGAKLKAGDVILEAQGSAASLHRAWKTAQTLIEWASGIATATADMVAAANGVTIACTRKNVPGTKIMSARAVKAGGAIMHRLGISETILVFPEHRLFLKETPARTIERLRRAQPEKKIIVEVASLEDAMLWAAAGVDILQLEKITPEALAACRKALTDASPHTAIPLLAAAGGIKQDNVAAYANAGPDILVTSAPYTAPPKDVQVNFLAVA